ncbi:MAG: hypothetical protein Q9205_000617 [Flavoplaca limonia]
MVVFQCLLPPLLKAPPSSVTKSTDDERQYVLDAFQDLTMEDAENVANEEADKNEANPNALYLMDLEYVKVVSQWKIHDDIPVKTFAPEKVNKFATCLSTHVENPFSHGFHTLLLPRFILLQLSSKPPIAATSSSSCAAGYVESLGGRHGGRECRSGGKGPRKKCAPTYVYLYRTRVTVIGHE